MQNSNLEQSFIYLIEDAKLPMPVEEYQFCKGRKWRFDFAYVGLKLAIEIEGGVWSNGRHRRPTGFIKDMEKYNEAALRGWKVLRYYCDNLPVATDDIKRFCQLRDIKIKNGKFVQ